MSLSVCVLDPSCAPDAVGEWGVGEDSAIVAGRLGGPQVVERLKAVRRPDLHLVLLHRETENADAAFLANVVSGALPHVPVTRLVIASSLLGAAVVALEAAHVEGEGDVARVARIATTLETTESGAWLRRVTRLDRPRPSFGQHLRSIFPWGPRFIARCGLQGRVVKAQPGGYDGPGTGRLVIGAEKGTTAADRVVAWYGEGDVAYVPSLVHDVKGVHGNPGVEYAVIDEALAAPGPQRGRCRVCGEPLHHEFCPFCHVLPQTPEVNPA